MPVKYILAQVGAKIGLNPSAAASRAVLLRYLNEAADELYTECDITGSLMEQTFKVNGNQTISMPLYVGAIRAVRESASQNAIKLNQMRPRYNTINWVDGWYNYRLKNTQALQASITNVSPVVVTVASVETPNVVVSITGSTATAQQVTDTFVMSSTSVNGTVSFTDIVGATKTIINGCDVVVSDIDGKLLTTIPNNELEARYQILDVSLAPWFSASAGGDANYVEVLFKKRLNILSNDNDEFPAQGYDNQLVNKCLQLYYEEQGKVEIAQAYDQKATRGLVRKKEEQNKATEDMVSVSRNPHDTILPRIRRGRRMYGFGFRSNS